MRSADDRGSTLPLIIGFLVVGFVVVAGVIAAGDAFVHQRSLQDVCDGAAAEAAASALDIQRGSGLGSGDALSFGNLDDAVAGYLARDETREDVQVRSDVAPDRRTVTLTCTETRSITFGALFGKGDGVRHEVTSSARAPLR